MPSQPEHSIDEEPTTSKPEHSTEIALTQTKKESVHQILKNKIIELVKD